MGTSEPVRAPPEVSRTRGHRLAKPRQIALSPNLGHSDPRSRARRWVLAARSWDFLSLPNFAPEVFVHVRRHVFVVRMRDVFAYRLRVLEAVTANAAMPLVAGEDVGAPPGAFRVVFGIGHFQNPVKRTATTTVTRRLRQRDRASPTACHGVREVAKKQRPARSGATEVGTTPLRGASIRITAAGAATAAIMHHAGDPLRGPVSEYRNDLYNLSAVGRPLQLSRWVEAVPALNSLAAATGNGAFWSEEENALGHEGGGGGGGRKTGGVRAPAGVFP